MTQVGCDEIDDKMGDSLPTTCSQAIIRPPHTSYSSTCKNLKTHHTILLICSCILYNTLGPLMHRTCKSRHWNGYLAITKCPQQLSRLLIENLPYSIYVQSKSCRRIQILVNTRSRNIYIHFVFVWILKLHSVFSH